MIKRLKKKVILLSMSSLFVILAVIVTGMNLINYRSVINEADQVLSVLSKNQGAFPEFMEEADGNMPDISENNMIPNLKPDMESVMDNEGGNEIPPEDMGTDIENESSSGTDGGMRDNADSRDKQPLPTGMSPELPYESRYFSISLKESGDIIHVDTSRITSVDSSMAIDYVEEVLEEDKNSGFVDNFRYMKYKDGDAVGISFLDCGRKLEAFWDFLFASLIMSVVGFVIVFFVISFFAGRIIGPIAESYEKQKRFITDAGHEIKTPLTIINANVDVLEMEVGENESLEDIKQQAKRLTALTNDLVYLAKMEESENSLQMIEFPVSEVVQDTVNSFKALAQTKENVIDCDIEPMLSMEGNSKSITQLVTILMDNAIKYSTNKGKISVKLSKSNKTLNLTVSNTANSDIQADNLKHIFDRFYRTDSSRNSETGGYGIGLSVAKAIVESHGGKIHACIKDDNLFKITVNLPV